MQYREIAFILVGCVAYAQEFAAVAIEEPRRGDIKQSRLLDLGQRRSRHKQEPPTLWGRPGNTVRPPPLGTPP
jgi:hypothetical protein